MHYREVKRRLKKIFPSAVFCGHGNEQIWHPTRHGPMPKSIATAPLWLKMDNVEGVPRVKILLDERGGLMPSVVMFNNKIKGFSSVEKFIDYIGGYSK